MVAAVESMAWTGEVPWHREGVKVDPNLTPQEMMIAASLDWTVSKRPGYTITTPEYGDGGMELMQTPSSFFIVRDTDNSILSHCGPKYLPVQNEKIFEFFSEFTTAAQMSMETAGSLRGGKSIWALAKLADTFELPGEDQIGGYLLLHQPHEASHALTARYTQIRVVCNNTLQLAFSNGKAHFSMSHIREFNADMAKQAAETLGLANDTSKLFRESAEFLAKKKAPHANVLEYIGRIYQPDVIEERLKNAQLKAEGRKIGEEGPLIDQFNHTTRNVVEALERAPGALLKSSAGTWWGALNAVTYVEDHMRGGENRVYNSLIGDGSKRKEKAYKMAIEYAEAA